MSAAWNKHQGAHEAFASSTKSVVCEQRGSNSSAAVHHCAGTRTQVVNRPVNSAAFQQFGLGKKHVTTLLQVAPKNWKKKRGGGIPSLQCVSAARSHRAGSSQLKAKEMLSVARRCFFP